MLKPITITIAYDVSDKEYRVPAPNDREAGAYYTNDRDDALGTARIIYADRGPVKFRIRRIYL